MPLLTLESETTANIAAHMLTLLEPDYLRGWLRVRQVGFSQLSEVLLFQDVHLTGLPVPLGTPERLMELADFLKEELREDKRGSWLILDFMVAASGEYELSVDYSSDPTVGMPAESFTHEDFRNELVAYPRAEEYQPEWLISYA